MIALSMYFAIGNTIGKRPAGTASVAGPATSEQINPGFWPYITPVAGTPDGLLTLSYSKRKHMPAMEVFWPNTVIRLDLRKVGAGEPLVFEEQTELVRSSTP